MNDQTLATANAAILLIDDTETNRYILARILRAAGYEVREACNGEEGLRCAQAFPALIIIDVGLPDMDGRLVCKKLKADPATATIPVIQMSAKFTEDRNMAEALEGGADGYLIQPVNSPVLIATVRALIRLSRVERERAELWEMEREARIEAEAERGKLQEAVRIRDEFLSIASHELNTPITSLKLQNQIRRRVLLRGDLAILERDEMVRLLENDGRQLSRLSRLVDDMLDITRISAGKLSLNYEKTDLSQVLEEVLDRFRSEFETACCPLDIEVQAAVLGDWDSFRIEQVLTNLFTNAIKYASGKPVHISLRQCAGEAVLVVRDEGSGIASEHQQRIFRRFERAISSCEVSGMGLGLYILQEIITAHEGSVQVESEPRQGATFTVRLPLDRPA